MIHISHRDGVAVVLDGGVWLLEEYRTYHVHGADRVQWAGQDLSPSACGAFVLELGAQTGKHTLSVTRGIEAGTYPFVVAANPTKLTGDDWLALLQEIEAWMPSAVTGPGGGQAGQVGTGGASAGWLVEALLPLLPSLVRAVRALTEELRMRSWSPLEERGLWSTTSVSGETMAWLARHPPAASWVVAGAVPVGRPPLVPVRVLRSHVDHPANRTLRWLIERVAKSLRAAAKALAPALVSHRDWCQGRMDALEASAGQLDRIVRGSPLSEVRAELALDGATGIFVDDTRYAQVFALARPFLSPSFALNDSDSGATLRPTFGLYEVWCLACLDRALRQLLDFEWTTRGHQTLLSPGHSGEGYVLAGAGPAGDVELHFNATFRSHHAGGGERRSTTAERRPDFAIGWRPRTGAPAWIVLDAKYRVGGGLLEAFGSLHIYRDALRWPAFGGRPAAGALLAPAETADVAVYFTADYRDAHGMGVFELRPGGSADGLVLWLGRALGIDLTATSMTKAHG